MYVGSQQELKNYDQYLLNHGYTIEELIDRASDCLLPHFKEYTNIGILVGPGNNGADGLSLAYKLHQLKRRVTVFYVGDPERFSKGNQFYFKKCEDADINMILVDDDVIDMLTERVNEFNVIADSFFGFGLNSAPRGMYKRVIDTINKYFLNEVIAIDIPTGLDCNSGKPYSTVVFASQTIALTAMKQGFLNPESQMVTGEVIVEELKIDNPFMEAGLYGIYTQKQASKDLKERKFDGYKNYYGTDLLIVGSKQYRGAPILAAKGAVYSGAGITKVLSDSSVISFLPQVIPEAIGIERPQTLNAEDLEGYAAILIGCGLGLDEQAQSYVESVLKESDAPLVIDADALTILSQHLDWLDSQHRPVILTPHMGEFKRLLHNKDIDDPMSEAQKFAQKYHVIMVLKGPYTMVTDGHTSYRIESGNKAMAVGGMGDTLAGVITAFAGQKYDALTAAALGVFIHGLSGDMLAEDRYTVLPEELSANIPHAMYLVNSKVNENKKF